jgi:F-type H+-transporting ATPase subunit b
MEVILPAKTMIYEVVVSLVSFLVLFGVLAKFAFPPITKMLDKRSDTIRESLEASEATRIEAERLLEEYKTQMTEARQEAAKVIDQGRKIAETMKNEIMAKATEDAQALLVKAREGIDAEKKAAIAELQGSVADLSVAVAGKLLGETLSAADHAKLIERYVSEVGALNEN